MTPKPRRRRTLPDSFCALILLALSSTLAADDYVEARARLVEAYQASDHDSMIVAARDALEARPDYPGGLFNLALSYALAGKQDAALAVIERLGDLCVDLGVDEHPAFEGLADSPRWAAIQNELDAMRRQMGSATVAFRLPDGPFIPEGIAVDGETLYVGSIRSGDIVRYDGAPASLLPGGDAGSVFGLRLHEGALWFAAAGIDQYAGPANPEGTGLFRLSLDEAATLERWPLPDDGATLGDFVVDGDVLYAADQQGGRLYRFTTESGFERIVDAGPLRSPQGLVMDDSGDALYVADWNRGLFRVSTDGATLSRIEADASLYGIDGLYRHEDWLIAVQNGIRPHRVTAHRLSEDGLSIVESRILLMNHPEFDEPTLGTIANGAFYLVANSHWNRFDRDGELPDGLAGPLILKLGLPTLP